MLSPKVKPLTHPGGVKQGHGLENSFSFASILIFGSREARSRGDRAKKIGSPHPRSREGSRGDRNWAVREGPRSAAVSPFPPGTEPHPACRAGRRRRGRPRPLQERRARPRKQGGAAARPGPRRRRSRGAQRAARCYPRCPPAGSSWSPPPPPWGEHRTWAPGGLGRTLRRTHRGRTAGGKDACKRSSESGDRFLSRPTPQVAAEAVAAETAAARRRRRQLPRLRNRRRRWRQLHFRSDHHFRSNPSPAPPLRLLLIGRAGHGVAPAA